MLLDLLHDELITLAENCQVYTMIANSISLGSKFPEDYLIGNTMSHNISIRNCYFRFIIHRFKKQPLRLYDSWTTHSLSNCFPHLSFDLRIKNSKQTHEAVHNKEQEL